MLRGLLEDLERQKFGLADHTCWNVAFGDLVGRFLRENGFPSEARRKRLACDLNRNPLKVAVAADLNGRAALTEKCLRLARERGSVFVRKHVQKPLKQLGRWAAAMNVLPSNPLRDWPLIDRVEEEVHYRALTPDEARAILAAAEERDGLLNRGRSVAMALRALLFTGNRPGVVVAANVRDLQGDRVMLPPQRGKKRNGYAYLPAVFAQELRADIAERGRADGRAPLLRSAMGSRIEVTNLSKEFKRCAVLAFVRLALAGRGVGDGDAREVAHSIGTGRLRGFDGAKPRDVKKIEAREKHSRSIRTLAASVARDVEGRMENLSLYSLKHTHITWARLFVPYDAVRAQVGHAGRDVEERNYLDASLLCPQDSAEVVWDVLVGRRSLRAPDRESKRRAVGADVDLIRDLTRDEAASNATLASHQPPQVPVGVGDEAGGPTWIRTRSLGIMSPLL